LHGRHSLRLHRRLGGGIQRGDISRGIFPRFVQLFLLFRVLDEFAIELHHIAALLIGLGRFEQRDDFLVALFQGGNLALNFFEMSLRLFARGGNGLALLGFFALLLLRFAGRTACRARGGCGFGRTAVGKLFARDEAELR